MDTPRRNASAYSWANIASIIVLIAAVIGMCCAFGAFYTSLKNAFDWSNTTTSALFSLHLILSGIFSFVGISVSKKFGTRLIVFAMGAVSGLGLFLSSLVDEGWQLFLTYGVVFAIANGAIGAIVMASCASLLQRKSGFSISVISIGVGLGIVVIFPIDTWLISEYGWQDTFIVNGIISWCLIAMASLFVREISYGNAVEEESIEAETGTEISSTDTSCSPQETANYGNNFLAFGILFAYSFCIYMVLCHFVPRLESMDFDTFDAGATLGLVGGTIIFSRLMIGFSTDALHNRSATIIFVLIHATALFWLIDSDTMWMFYLFAVVIGSSLSGTDFPVAVILGNDLRHWQNGNRLIFVLMGWFLGAAAGPFFSGLILDNTDNYEFAFFFGGIVMVLAATFIWVMKQHQHPETESDEVDS